MGLFFYFNVLFIFKFYYFLVIFMIDEGIYLIYMVIRIIVMGRGKGVVLCRIENIYFV